MCESGRDTIASAEPSGARDTTAETETPQPIRPTQERGASLSLLVFWVLVGFAIRVVVFCFSPYIGNADQVSYTLEAHRLLHGGIPPIHHGFVALIAAALKLGVPDERAAQVVSLVFGTLVLPVVWALTRRLSGNPAASTAALAIAVLNAQLVEASTDGMTDGTFLFFVLAAVLCAAVALQPTAHPLIWASCGLLLGIAYTIRVEALVYFAGLGVAIAIIAYFERWPWRRCTYAILSTTAGFAVVVGTFSAAINVNPLRPAGAPVTALLQYDPEYADKAELLREAYKRDLSPEQLERLGAESLPSVSLGDYVKRWVHNLYAQMWEVLPRTIDLPLWSLGIIGLSGMLGDRRRWKNDLLLLSLWSFFFTAAPLFQLVHVRHLLTYLAAFCCWAGVGAVTVGELYAGAFRSESPTAWRRALFAAVALVCFVQLKPDVDLVRRIFTGDVPLEEKAAGQWLKNYGSPDDIVLERKTVVAFYARMQRGEIPYGPLDVCLGYNKKKGARFVVVSTRRTPEYRPQLKPLLEDDESAWEPHLSLIHEERNPYAPQYRLRIFEFTSFRNRPPSASAPPPNWSTR